VIVPLPGVTLVMAGVAGAPTETVDDVAPGPEVLVATTASVVVASAALGVKVSDVAIGLVVEATVVPAVFTTL
jgi:hypothetical protein